MSSREQVEHVVQVPAGVQSSRQDLHLPGNCDCRTFVGCAGEFVAASAPLPTDLTHFMRHGVRASLYRGAIARPSWSCVKHIS